MIKRAVFALAAMVLAGCLGGCPSGGGVSTPAISGTWSGTGHFTMTMTVDDQQVLNTAADAQFSVTFGADGLPTGQDVFAGATPQSTDLAQPGQTATFTMSNSASGVSFDVTVIATVREATYTPTSAHVVIDLSTTSSFAGSTSISTGTQTTDATVSGNTLTYSLSVVMTGSQTTTVPTPDPNNPGGVINTTKVTTTRTEITRTGVLEHSS